MGIETLAIASLGLTAVGSGVSALGAYNTNMAASEAATYRAGVADINAKIAKQQGQVEAFNHSLKVGQILGTQKATQAASGVDVNFGSPVNVRASTSEMGKLDQLTILNNASKKAFGFMAQSDLEKSAASNYEKAGILGAFSNTLAGATSVSDKWLKYQMSGVL